MSIVIDDCNKILDALNDIYFAINRVLSEESKTNLIKVEQELKNIIWVESEKETLNAN